MKEKDKKYIKIQNSINYFQYKIESNKKYIEYLKQSNIIYEKILELYKENLKKIKEEIEVLDE